jgi:hypothetical protein
MEPTFKLTPSFISSLIEQSAQLKSESDVIIAFNKLSELQPNTLKKEHAKALSDSTHRRNLLLKDIPEKLRPLADALYGLISVEPTEEEIPEKKEKPQTTSFSNSIPLAIKKDNLS